MIIAQREALAVEAATIESFVHLVTHDRSATLEEDFIRTVIQCSQTYQTQVPTPSRAYAGREMLFHPVQAVRVAPLHFDRFP